jgi:hypothetical protein
MDFVVGPGSRVAGEWVALAVGVDLDIGAAAGP